MSSSLPANAHTAGPRCGKCRNTEARCAWSYPCCENCSHFQEPRPIGRPRKDGKPPRPTLVKQEPASADPIDWQYRWYVAETGVAHAHITAQARSTCGHVVGTVGGPVQTWEPTCKACLRHTA